MSNTIRLKREMLAYIGDKFKGRRYISDYIQAIISRISREHYIECSKAYEIAEKLACKYSGNPDSTLNRFNYLQYPAHGHFHKGRTTNPYGFMIYDDSKWGVYTDIKSKIVNNKRCEELSKVDNFNSYIYSDKLDIQYRINTNDISMIKKCELCRKYSSSQYTYFRSDVYEWDNPRRMDGSKIRYCGKLKNTLCTGCWNKARAVKRVLDKADGLRSLNVKLKKESKNV
ncbi:MAG: hypothetical protein COA63_000990 [Methylophaga sp.]|nr:hypothetical protein [Methylophaga sp.]